MKHNNVIHTFIVLIAFALFSIAFAFTAFAGEGWSYYSGGWHYFNADNSVLKNTTQVIDGESRTFDEKGICDTGFKTPLEVPDRKSMNETAKKVEQMCDKVLGEIIKPGMTDKEKITAIYSWIQQNMSYVDHSAKDDRFEAAYEGFRAKSGDCYTYYGLSAALLTRAGFQCLEVTRVTDNRHWWVKVRTQDGWYHFDATPRRADSVSFCLMTDDALMEYSIQHTNANGYTTHHFDPALYPPSPKS